LLVHIAIADAVDNQDAQLTLRHAFHIRQHSSQWPNTFSEGTRNGKRHLSNQGQAEKRREGEEPDNASVFFSLLPSPFGLAADASLGTLQLAVGH